MDNIELSDQEFLKELFEEFREEATQRLTNIENLLLSYKPEYKEKGIEIKRELHTLKGSAGMLGLETLSKIAHKLEDLFKESEDKNLFSSDFLFFLLDSISAIKEFLKSNTQSDESLSSLFSKVENYKLKNIKDEGTELPHDETFQVNQNTKYLTIEVDKIDEFLNTLGELIFREEALIEKKSGMKEINNLAKRKLKGEEFSDLKQKIEVMYYLMKDYINYTKVYMEKIKNHIYLLRTQPLSSIFNTFPSQVFRIAHSLGKEVDFKVIGGEIQLDRRIISQISEPLLHMIRNAIDHGIESPEERRKKGKNEKGRVVLSARYMGDNVFIELEDDGRGIDIEAIKKKVIENHLLTEEELENLDEQGIMNLIFTPGFSTKTETTMVSGRGIGMDIVKNKVTQVGGEVYIESQKDRYTKIILRFPVALGIGRILFMRIKDFTFGVFSYHVVRVLKKKYMEEVLLGRERFIKLEKNIIPIIELSDILSLPCEERYYIHFFVNGQNFVIPVDEVIDEREAMIRPFSLYLIKRLKPFNSFAILQEGKIIPLIEMQSMYNYRTIYKSLFEREKAYHLPISLEKVLLVEDAPVTRKMESMILREEGFFVYEASNGKEALEVLEKDPEISLVITDLEMPVMDGGELILRIREKDKEIPIVVVTTLKEEEIKKEVFDLSTFILQKKDFSRGEFIQRIRELLKK